MHLNSNLLFEKYALSYFKDNDKVLEIGPDIVPSSLQLLVNRPHMVWHTLNLEIGEQTSRTKNSELTILSENEYNYPIADSTYDVIVSANVLEHVKKFWRWFEELKRIVKPGGYIISIAPISWPYHEAPVDCWRIYPDGIRALYEDIGLRDALSVFESLEYDLKKNTFTPIMPWATNINSKKESIINGYNRLLSLFPFTKILRAPLTVSYDLISIAQKEQN
jgi:SAM-dependent methyltransferase